jgi:hypothetical protein
VWNATQLNSSSQVWNATASGWTTFGSQLNNSSNYTNTNTTTSASAIIESILLQLINKIIDQLIGEVTQLLYTSILSPDEFVKKLWDLLDIRKLISENIGDVLMTELQANVHTAAEKKILNDAIYMANLPEKLESDAKTELKDMVAKHFKNYLVRLVLDEAIDFAVDSMGKIIETAIEVKHKRSINNDNLTTSTLSSTALSQTMPNATAFNNGSTVASSMHTAAMSQAPQLIAILSALLQPASVSAQPSIPQAQIGGGAGQSTMISQLYNVRYCMTICRKRADTFHAFSKAFVYF